jgi:hypothetical protein
MHTTPNTPTLDELRRDAQEAAKDAAACLARLVDKLDLAEPVSGYTPAEALYEIADVEEQLRSAVERRDVTHRALIAALEEASR